MDLADQTFDCVKKRMVKQTFFEPLEYIYSHVAMQSLQYTLLIGDFLSMLWFGRHKKQKEAIKCENLLHLLVFNFKSPNGK